MKQNKKHVAINEQIIIAPVCFILCIILLITLCSVPGLAISTNNVDFSDQPFAYNVSIEVARIGSSSYYVNNSGSPDYSGCYYFCAKTDSRYRVISAGYDGDGFASPGVSGNNIATNSSATLYSDGLYYIYSSSYAFYDNNLTNTIPSYDSIEAGLIDILSINSSSSNPYDLDYSLPPGNVAFVELTSDSSDLILTTDMPNLSNLFGQAWSNVSQMYGYSNSLPSSGTSFNTTGLSTIDWSKAAPFNVLGQSKNAAKILSVSTSSTYLVIYNPLYFYVRDGGNGAESSFLDNGYIRIRLNDVSNVKVFSLTSSAQIGPNASTEDAISSTVTSSGVTQTIDPDTGLPIWTDSDGNTVEAPGVGTGNIASSGTTTFSILQQIADTISNFFQGSVGAISNLIDNGSSFMSKLGTLYSWLPPPVYAVLTSALILVITIGVIKVFL